MKRLAILIIALCCCLVFLSGCKIEFPERVSSSSSAWQDSSLSASSDASFNGQSSKAAESVTTSRRTDSTVTSSKTSSTSSKGNGGSSSAATTSSNKTSSVSSNNALTCTISIDCKTILNNMAKFNQDKLSVLPKDGVILPSTTIEFKDGDTVFDILVKVTKGRGVHMEYNEVPLYGSDYIEGIGNIYEYDCGELSGWRYNVNGAYPNEGCNNYKLKKGDKIAWRYTCNMGKDIT